MNKNPVDPAARSIDDSQTTGLIGFLGAPSDPHTEIANLLVVLVIIIIIIPRTTSYEY